MFPTRHYARVYGLNQDYVLNILQNCHTAVEALVQDVLHIIFEGIVVEILQLQLCFKNYCLKAFAEMK